MKNIYQYTLAFLLLCVINLASHATDIKIISGQELVAPEGSDYSWAYAGITLDKNTSTICAEKAGKYIVRYLDTNGQPQTATITVTIGEDGKIYRVWTIGDSTVQEYDPFWYPRMGWGQVLQHYFDTTKVEVINKGVGGTSAKSFYEGFWPEIVEQLQEGDYVFIQFGINDAARDDRRTEPFGTFQEYLMKYVNESKANGAYPVIVPTLRRNAWNADGVTVYNAYHDYPVAARALAKEQNLPMIDLDSLSKVSMENVGMEYTGPFWYMHLNPGDYPYPWQDGNADNVHFQSMGAIEMARLVTEGIRLNAADEKMNILVDALKEKQTVSISASDPSALLVTNSGEFPAGTKIILRAFVRDTATHVFAGWYKDGELYSRNTFFDYTVTDGAVGFEARVDTDKSKIDCTGIYDGGAFVDECGYCVRGATVWDPCVTSFDFDKYYEIKTTDPNYNFAIDEDGVLVRQAVGTWSTDIWQVEATENGFVKIKNVVLDQYLLKSTPSLKLSETGSEWRMELLDDGSYRLALSLSLGLDIAVATENDGSDKKATVIERAKGGYDHEFNFVETALLAAYEPNQNFQVFPNPVKDGIVQLTLDEHLLSEQVQIEVLDLQGKIMKQLKPTSANLQWDLSQLNAGIYFLRVSNGQEIISTKKILIY